MNKKTPLPKPSLTVKVLNVLMAIALIVTVILFFRMISEIRSASARDRYGSISYSLRDGSYGDMVREYYHRYFDVAPFHSDYEEEYHLAAYADAAFRFRFYAGTCNQPAAERTARKMDEEQSLAGSLSSLTGEVDEILNEAFPTKP